MIACELIVLELLDLFNIFFISSYHFLLSYHFSSGFFFCRANERLECVAFDVGMKIAEMFEWIYHLDEII